MSIYNVNGEEVTAAYSKDGTLLTTAYDIDGEQAYNPSFTVMSYNIQRYDGLNSNAQMQKDIINTYNPLIIGLQELGASPDIDRNDVFADCEYDFLYSGTQPNRTVLASKRQLSDVSFVLFQNQSGENRGYNKAYLNYGGKMILWLNTHLEAYSASARAAQASELFDLVEDEPYFIITGDLNAPCKTVNDTEYISCIKQFVDAGFHLANCSPEFGFLDTFTEGKSLTEKAWLCLDHIITSEKITINSVIVDDRKIALAEQTQQVIDHLPIIANVTIN